MHQWLSVLLQLVSKSQGNNGFSQAMLGSSNGAGENEYTKAYILTTMGELLAGLVLTEIWIGYFAYLGLAGVISP